MRVMRFLLVVPLIITAVMLCLLSGAGCSSGGDALVGAMRKLPVGGDGFLFVDAGAMRDSRETEGLYESLGGLAEGVYDVEDYLGFSLDDTTSVAANGDVFLASGAFDLDGVRARLKARDCDDDKYRDVEIWEDGASAGGVALYDAGLIIVAGATDDLRECIDVIKDREGWLYGDADYKEMAARLPAGMVVVCTDPSSAGSWWDGVDQSYGSNVDMAGLAVSREGSKDLLVTLVLKFDTETHAADAENEVPEDIEDLAETYLDDCLQIGQVVVEGSRDDDYLKVTARMALEPVADALEDLLDSRENVASANAELVTLQAAIEACLAAANRGSFDAAVIGWTGGEADSPVCTVGSQKVTVYSKMQTHELKASYDISLRGDVTAATSAGWGRFVTFRAATGRWVFDWLCEAPSAKTLADSANAELLMVRDAVEDAMAQAGSSILLNISLPWSGAVSSSPYVQGPTESVKVSEMMTVHQLRAAYTFDSSGNVVSGNPTIAGGWGILIEWDAAADVWVVAG